VFFIRSFARLFIRSFIHLFIHLFIHSLIYHPFIRALLTRLILLAVSYVEDYIGNACEDDYDMDGVSDKYDDCPANRFIANTDMRRYNNIDLYPELGSSSPGWLVLHQGKEVRQLISTTMPALMIGKALWKRSAVGQ